MRFNGRSPMQMLMAALRIKVKSGTGVDSGVAKKEAHEKLLAWKRKNGHTKMKSSHKRVKEGHGGHEKMVRGKTVTVNQRMHTIVKVGKPTRRGLKNSVLLEKIV